MDHKQVYIPLFRFCNLYITKQQENTNFQSFFSIFSCKYYVITVLLQCTTTLVHCYNIVKSIIMKIQNIDNRIA